MKVKIADAASLGFFHMRVGCKLITLLEMLRYIYDDPHLSIDSIPNKLNDLKQLSPPWYVNIINELEKIKNNHNHMGWWDFYKLLSTTYLSTEVTLKKVCCILLSIVNKL